MNKRAINEKIVDEWKDKAGDRKTVVFCSTVVHAQDVCDEFRRKNVRTEKIEDAKLGITFEDMRTRGLTKTEDILENKNNPKIIAKYKLEDNLYKYISM